MKKLSALMLIAILLVVSAIPVFATNQTDDENITPEEIVLDDENITSDEIVVDENVTIPEEIVIDDESITSDEVVVDENITIPEEIVVDNESISPLDAEDPVEALATGTPITSLSDILPGSSGNYYLTANTIELANALTVASGENVTLDFNGHTVTSSVSGRPFNNFGTLTLLDSSPGGGGGVNGNYGSDSDTFGSVVNQNGATLIINSGNYSADNNGSCVRNESGGTVTINGGTFTNIRGLANYGTATINDGTFNQTPFAGFNAYKIWNAGELTIKNATVNGDNGGVAHVNGNLTIEKGSFSANTFYALYIANVNESGADGTLSATINGGTYTSTNTFALWVDISRDTLANNPVAFTGGVFTGSTGAANFIIPSGDPGPISPLLTGGTYTNSNLRDYVATGYRQNLGDRSPAWTVVPDVYDVTVINGDILSSKSSFAPGEVVNVSANWPERGYVFDKWTSAPAVALNDASSTSTSFIMPADDVTLTANYKNVGISKYEVLKNFNDFKGSGTSSATVEANGDLLLELYLGDKPLSPEEEYHISEDGKTITLTEAFLKTLKNGTYKLQAQYQLGYADLSLTVAKPDDNGGNGNGGDGSSNNNSGKSKSPSTGDYTNISLYGLLLVLSLIGIGVTYKRRKIN